MKDMLRVIMIGVLLMSAVGCASTRQLVPFPDQSKKIEDPSKGRIYVFRPSIFAYAIPMQIDDNNKAIGLTGPRGYLCWERKPGKTRIVGHAENTSELPLEIHKGKVYYIYQHMRLGWLWARNKLELVDEVVGREYLQDCNPPEGVKEK